MRKLFILLISVFLITTLYAKSPHGENFKMDCAVCHNTDDWTKVKTDGFNHEKTKFPLVGQHKTVECQKCHTSLDFSKAKTECAACHLDVHQQTVGRDCERCHTPNSWIVTNVKQIHQQRGFPLIGAHASADCNRCHTSASALRFDNLRTDCYDCHKAQYDATSKPNHVAAGYDTDCFRCHNMVGRDWSSIGKGFEHGFFPLTGSHNIECSSCHTDAGFQKKIEPKCNLCHSHTDDYARAKSSHPAHITKYGSYECSSCHNSLSWNSVRFTQHDSWFGIYSGNHKGEWDKCTDCHNNDASYKAECKRCHD